LPTPASAKGRFSKLLGRALALRCPVCGQGKLYRSWFAMHTECPQCGIRYEREPGFFLGSIYINYGLTVLIVAIAYPVLLFGYGMPETPLLIGSLAFTLLFPMALFPWARSLWLGFDEWRDPREEEESTR